MPSMAAPSETRKRARSWTWGSDAAFRSTVVPDARTAAINAFSVPVTLGSSRKISAPLSLPSSVYASPTETSAPSRSSARKCVSTRRRPITSPPGGGSCTRPKRASIGPARRIEARMRAHSCGSSSRGVAGRASTVTAFFPVHSTLAPRCVRRASIVSTSRMRGTLSSRQGPSASSVAARMGRAAFLLPAGRIVPWSGRPPETQNVDAMGCGKLRRGLRRRQALANVRGVHPLLALALLAVAGLAATRVHWPRLAPRLRRDAALAPGLPLVLVGLVLGPGIGLLDRAAVRALTPVPALAATLDAIFGVLAFAVIIGVSRPRDAAAGVELGRAAWLAMTLGSGMLVGMAFLSVTRLRPVADELGFALLGAVLFGAGAAYASGSNPLLVCAIAAALIVNLAPQRRGVRARLGAWEHRATTGLFLMMGALLALPPR